MAATPLKLDLREPLDQKIDEVMKMYPELQITQDKASVVKGTRMLKINGHKTTVKLVGKVNPERQEKRKKKKERKTRTCDKKKERKNLGR